MLILPLGIWLGVEATLAALLCAPVKPLTNLALLATGFLRRRSVRIVLMTAGAMFLVVLVFSVARMSHLRDVMARPVATSGAASVFHEARQELYSEGIQSCLIGARAHSCLPHQALGPRATRTDRAPGPRSPCSRVEASRGGTAACD